MMFVARLFDRGTGALAVAWSFDVSRGSAEPAMPARRASRGLCGLLAPRRGGGACGQPLTP